MLTNISVNSGKLVQFFCALCGSLVTISDGIQYGWTAPVASILLSENTPIEITNQELEWMENLYIIGFLCGLLVAIPLADGIGRKYAVLLASLTHTSVWAVYFFTNNAVCLLVARFFAGVATLINVISASSYIAEISDKEIRGILGSLISTSMTLGVVVAYSLLPYTSYSTTCLVCLCMSSAVTVSLLSLPKSPYYLVLKNHPQETVTVLRFLRRKDDVEEELKNIFKEVKKKSNEATRFRDIFSRSNRKALLIMAILNSGQHFLGYGVILMNMHTILEKTDSDIIDHNYAALIFSIIMFVTCLFSSFLVDKFGRKMLLVFSCTLLGLCMISLAAYFSLQVNGNDVSGIGWLPSVTVMIYALAFRAGLGFVAMGLTAELFPTQLRVLGSVLSYLVYGVTAVCALLIYQNLEKIWGMHVPFIIFSIWSIGTLAFILWFVPETRGKTLEEIQSILRGRDSSK